MNYLPRYKRLGDTEGLKPLSGDFDLRRGVPVRFRLIDKETQKPVRGCFNYTPLRNNPFYSEAEEQPGLSPTRGFFHFRARQDKDHYFNMVAYPGPGAILASSMFGDRPYLPARPDPADAAKGYFNGDSVLHPTSSFLSLCDGYRVLDTD